VASCPHHSTAWLATGGTGSQAGPAQGLGPSAKPWEICSLTRPTEATFCMATGVHFGWGVLGSRLKDEGKG